MRKKINYFLYRKWPTMYRKLRDVRIWFYGFEEDYGRKYDAIHEPANFAIQRINETHPGGFDAWVDEIVEEAKHDIHDFHESDKVFH